MSEKKKDLAAQSRREDEMLNRTLLWIGGAAILILFLLLVNRYYIHYRVSEIYLAVVLNSYILPAIAVCGLVVCVASLLLARKGGARAKWLTALALLCGGLALCAAVSRYFHETGVRFMCAAIPAAAVLALVYYLFQREFFLIALSSAGAIAALWTIRRAGTGHTAIRYGILAAALVLLAALAFAVRKLQAAGGMWKQKRVLSKNTAYGMLYLTCAVLAILLIAAVVAGPSAAYYLLFPAVAWLVIMTVYFTVKLM